MKDREWDLAYAEEQAKELCSDCHRALPPASRNIIEVVGSIRRQRPKVHDIDILMYVPPDDSAALSALDRWFHDRLAFPIGLSIKGRKVIRVEASSTMPSRDFFLYWDLQMRGPQQQCWTGSEGHNVALRRWAKKHGSRVSQNEVTVRGTKIEAVTEDHVYWALGLSVPEPQDRDRLNDESAIQSLVR